MSIYNNMNCISVVLIWDVVTFPKISNIYATRFSSDAKRFARVELFHSKFIRFMCRISCRRRNEPETQSARTCNTEFGIVTNLSQPPNQRRVQSKAVNLS